MLTYKESIELINTLDVKVSIEEVKLADSLDFVLAEDVFADCDIPQFNKSAMDGFACRMKDLKNNLSVIETIPAGKKPLDAILKNQCSRIMTGAEIPNGADCVIMFEHTQEQDGVVKFTGKNTKSNIIIKGEDITNGQLVLKKGIKIKAQHLAALASVGKAKVKVYKKPSVGIVVTGDEIIEPGEKLEPSKIRNSNAYQIMGQLQKHGIAANYYGIAKDNKVELKKKLQQGIEESDLLVITGGVSKGDFDFVPTILEELDFKFLFKQLAIQPGKPVSMAIAKNKICYGLSGNPVSSFLQFELLVLPMLYLLMGTKFIPVDLSLELTNEYSRKKGDRFKFFPVKIVDSKFAEPLEFHGSSHLLSLNEADGFAMMEVNKLSFKKGEKVRVRLF